jgi:hypothetical protein
MKNAVFWDVTPVALVRTDVSEERMAAIIRVKRIGEVETTLAVTRSRSRVADCCHCDDEGNTCLNNVGSDESRTVSHFKRRHS